MILLHLFYHGNGGLFLVFLWLCVALYLLRKPIGGCMSYIILFPLFLPLLIIYFITGWEPDWLKKKDKKD